SPIRIIKLHGKRIINKLVRVEVDITGIYRNPFSNGIVRLEFINQILCRRIHPVSTKSLIHAWQVKSPMEGSILKLMVAINGILSCQILNFQYGSFGIFGARLKKMLVISSIYSSIPIGIQGKPAAIHDFL